MEANKQKKKGMGHGKNNNFTESLFYARHYARYCTWILFNSYHSLSFESFPLLACYIICGLQGKRRM